MAISHADKRLFSETEREISCRRAQHMSAVVPHWPRIVGRGVLEVMGVMYVRHIGLDPLRRIGRHR